MYVMFTTVPQFVETPARDHYGFGASVTQSGLDLLPFALAMLVIAPLTGRLSVAFGRSPGPAGRLHLLGLVLRRAGRSGTAHTWQIMSPPRLLGIGIAMGYAAMSNLVVEAVPQSQTGVATGMNTNIRNIGRRRRGRRGHQHGGEQPPAQRRPRPSTATSWPSWSPPSAS